MLLWQKLGVTVVAFDVCTQGYFCSYSDCCNGFFWLLWLHLVLLWIPLAPVVTLVVTMDTLGSSTNVLDCCYGDTWSLLSLQFDVAMVTFVASTQDCFYGFIDYYHDYFWLLWLHLVVTTNTLGCYYRCTLLLLWIHYTVGMVAIGGCHGNTCSEYT